MDLPTIKNSLADAGCEEALANEIICLYRGGQNEDALRKMKLARCRAVSILHECSRKVDLLDNLIRKAEKEQSISK